MILVYLEEYPSSFEGYMNSKEISLAIKKPHFYLPIQRCFFSEHMLLYTENRHTRLFKTTYRITRFRAKRNAQYQQVHRLHSTDNEAGTPVE